MTDPNAPEDQVQDVPDDTGGEGDPIPVHPLDPGVGVIPVDFPPDDFDREKDGLAQFRVELRYAASADEVKAGLSADYVNGHPLQLPFEETRGSFLLDVKPDTSRGAADGKHFLVSVAGRRGVYPGNLILLLVKVKATGQERQVGVALGKLSLLTEFTRAASY